MSLVVKLRIITYKRALRTALFAGWDKIAEPETQTLCGDWRDFLLEGAKGFFIWVIHLIGRVLMSFFAPISALLVMHFTRLSVIRHLQGKYWLGRTQFDEDIQIAYKHVRSEANRIITKSVEMGEVTYE